jgi:hypothetical protein
MATIIFNGKSYNSLEEMAPNEKQAYEQMMEIFVDANGNGVPDFLEGDVVQNLLSKYSTTTSVEGKVVYGLEELPPEMQQSVQTAFKKLTQFGILPGEMPITNQMQNPQVGQEPIIQSRPFISREFQPVIEEDKGSNALPWMLAGAALLFCLALAAFAVFYFMG